MKIQDIINLVTSKLAPAPEYPTVLYPTILEGIVMAEKLRVESLDGSELYITPAMCAFGWNGIGYDQGGRAFILKNTPPFPYQGKTWGVSHQQKWSKYGWLRTFPDCYHRWWFWRLQQTDAQGNWLPGTEEGLYLRKPFSWRWDVAGTNGKHWIWTNGFLGGHWD